ncbi:UNVERIFIED_CONTAM: hypothetical protein HDU68_003106 [Siphonaria sp. JEL0065]|nr:hypothetical protein HDU68_003106 [Siphonaria sp. JEL0065]
MDQSTGTRVVRLERSRVEGTRHLLINVFPWLDGDQYQCPSGTTCQSVGGVDSCVGNETTTAPTVGQTSSTTTTTIGKPSSTTTTTTVVKTSSTTTTTIAKTSTKAATTSTTTTKKATTTAVAGGISNGVACTTYVAFVPTLPIMFWCGNVRLTSLAKGTYMVVLNPVS